MERSILATVHLLLRLHVKVCKLALLLTAWLVRGDQRLRDECRLNGQLIPLGPLGIVLGGERGVAAIVVEQSRVCFLRLASHTQLDREGVFIEVVLQIDLFFILV